jgi:predicted nucleic acid-binding Zn ribbon protein
VQTPFRFESTLGFHQMMTHSCGRIIDVTLHESMANQTNSFAKNVLLWPPMLRRRKHKTSAAVPAQTSQNSYTRLRIVAVQAFFRRSPVRVRHGRGSRHAETKAAKAYKG